MFPETLLKAQVAAAPEHSRKRSLLTAEDLQHDLVVTSPEVSVFTVKCIETLTKEHKKHLLHYGQRPFWLSSTSHIESNLLPPVKPESERKHDTGGGWWFL